jgi:glucan phosphoethanolaminetransferase (alkaline phosphatase superfamily)
MSRSARKPTATPAPLTSRSGRSIWLFAIAGLLVIGLGAYYAWMRPPARPQAIVLISIDTLRADHLSLYGYQKGRTPALDALAKDAVLFERWSGGDQRSGGEQRD